jgi:hypothetical protein
MSTNTGAVTPTPFGNTQLWIGRLVLYGSSIAAIGLFITSIVMASQFVGSKDNWNDIQPQIVKVWIFSLIGKLFLCIASYMYFIQNPAHTLMFTLILTCISLGLAYSAVAIAVITR